MSIRTKLERMIDYADTLEKNQRSDPKSVDRGWPDVDSVDFQKARNSLYQALRQIEAAFDRGEAEAEKFRKKFATTVIWPL